MSAPTAVDRKLLLERDDHRCVACATGWALEAQHRQAVGMGGSKIRPTLSQLIVLCSRHNVAVERELQMSALRFGWKVRAWVGHAGLVPVFYPYEGKWFRLDMLGGRTHISHFEAMAMMHAEYGDEYDPARGLVRR